MARVFTTEIFFHSYLVRVLVSIRDEAQGLIVSIRVFDEEAIRILGSDSIEFIGLTGYRQLEVIKHPLALELLDRIFDAMLDQLNKTP